MFLMSAIKGLVRHRMRMCPLYLYYLCPDSLDFLLDSPSPPSVNHDLEQYESNDSLKHYLLNTDDECSDVDNETPAPQNDTATSK